MGTHGEDRLRRLDRMRLCVITGDAGGIEETARIVEAALEGGADVVQMRKKDMPKADQYRLGSRLRVMTQEHGALLIVNDHVDLALAIDADGVHLGQDDLPLLVVRALDGFEGRLVGCSTHSLEQARRALRDGADYLGVGPVFATPTKPGGPAVGTGLVREVASNLAVPFVAIGGIEASNVGQVIQAGARAVAVVRAVYEAADPAGVARSLRAAVEDQLKVEA
jgi:thiamine-phosphate pyrophosphorylase